jgi:hypothetical protein
MVFMTLVTLITAISGFFLGTGGDVDGALLQWHRYAGGGLALLVALWYAVWRNSTSREYGIKILQGIIAILVLVTGHYGGMLTHGPDFLALPTSRETKPLSENPLVYEEVVFPILDENCVSCHNTNKKKGGLLMTNLESILKGGESGKTLVPGDAVNSEIIRRLYLPKNDEKHMPPDGKKPLEADQIAILERWVGLGASDTLRLNHLSIGEPLLGLIESLREEVVSNGWQSLPKVADTTLQRLSSDYLTISRMLNNSNALRVAAFMPPQYDESMLLPLKDIAGNIVQLDVSGLPLGQKELAVIANCTSLEWLELDGTPVTDASLEFLPKLQNLKLLKLYQTAVGNATLKGLGQLPNLKKLFVWNTNIGQEALTRFAKENQHIMINTGINPETQNFFTQKDTLRNVISP